MFITPWHLLPGNGITYLHAVTGLRYQHLRNGVNYPYAVTHLRNGVIRDLEKNKLVD